MMGCRRSRTTPFYWKKNWKIGMNALTEVHIMVPLWNLYEPFLSVSALERMRGVLEEEYDNTTRKKKKGGKKKDV